MDMLEEILKVVPSGDLMDKLIKGMKINFEEAMSQFESGKNEGAAIQVGLAMAKLNELEQIFSKVYNKSA